MALFCRAWQGLVGLWQGLEMWMEGRLRAVKGRVDGFEVGRGIVVESDRELSDRKTIRTGGAVVGTPKLCTIPVKPKYRTVPASHPRVYCLQEGI